MEILFVSHKFPPAVGGMEKQSYELITGMERHCRVHRIVYDGNGSILTYFLTLRRKILTLCKAHPGIQVIHFNDALLASFCLWHKGYDHLKRAVTLHGLDVVFPSSFYRKNVLPKFNRFDHLIAVSRATANQAIALGIAAEKVSVINNGVDHEEASLNLTYGARSEILSQYGIPPDQCILTAVGRPVKRKGFSWFIRTVVPVLTGPFFVVLIGPYDEHPGIMERLLSILPANMRHKFMLFLGFGSDKASLRTSLQSFGPGSKVKHIGKLPAEHKRVILESSLAFIMPNIHVDGDMEGFGLVCLEAVMAGTLVFAADVDGIPDAIQDEKNGFLLPSGNADIWAQSLNELIANPQIFKEKKQAFRKFTSSHYSWDKMVQDYFDLFLTLPDLQGNERPVNFH